MGDVNTICYLTVADTVRPLLVDEAEYLGRALVFPRELTGLGHVAWGGLFIMGEGDGRKLQTSYTIHAVDGSEARSFSLVALGPRDDRAVPGMLAGPGRSVYGVTVPGLGSFAFEAVRVVPALPYGGSVVSLQGLKAVRRLRPWQPDRLDQLCMERNFFFTGYSPGIDNLAT